MVSLPTVSSSFVWRFLAIAAVVLVVGGYIVFGQQKSVGATFPVVQGDFKEQVSVSGTVTPAKSVDLGFATNGRLSSITAIVGQHVAAGTMIAEIENGDLVASLAQKKSMLAAAQANLASLQAGTRPEEIAVAETGVTNATTALVSALQNAYTTSDDAIHNRSDVLFTNPRTDPKLSFSVANASLETLVEQDRAAIEPVLAAWAVLIAKLTNGTAVDAAKQSQQYLTQVTALLAEENAVLNQGIPDQTASAATLSAYGTTLATARTNVNTVATALTAAVAALDAAQSTLALKQAGSTPDAIAAQQAVVAAAQADVENAQALLAKTLVVAPWSGTVTRMDAKVGEIVSPSTSEISMQSDGLFEIETYVPEVSIAHIAVGNPATTTLDAYGSSVAFPAVVLAVDPAETMKDGVPTYKTTLGFLKKDDRIRSGMTANVVIETGVLHDAIVIPSGAVGMKGGTSYVSVVHNDTVEFRPVTIGATPALGQSEILTGLTAGETILLTPAP